jgi:hypothetical protein
MIKAKVVFDNGYKTICSNRRVNLNSDGIFSNTPEGFYVQMLLDPVKEQFQLPSVFIKQGNMSSLDCEVVGKVSVGSLMLRRVVNNTSDKTWIFLFSLLSCKPYHLVAENIVRMFKKVFSINDFILNMPSLAYYEVGSDKIDIKSRSRSKYPRSKI